MAKKINKQVKFKYELDYVSRDVSWIRFNNRVLHQSTREEIPVLERFRFAGIASNNLDEFSSVRFASVLTRKITKTPEISGLSPKEEINILLKEIMASKADISIQYEKIQMALPGTVSFNYWDDLSEKDQKKALKLALKYKDDMQYFIYRNEDELDDLSKLLGNTLYMLCTVKHSDLTIVLDLSKVPRLISLTKPDSKIKKYVFMEEVLRNNVKKLFTKPIQLASCGCFRLIKHADTSIEDVDDDMSYPEKVMESIKEREDDTIIVDMDMYLYEHESVRKLFKNAYALKENRLMSRGKLCEYNFMMEIPNLLGDYMPMEGLYKKFKPKKHIRFKKGKDIYKQVKKSDVVLQHPYTSYESVIDMLEQAVADASVTAIRQTLYRVSDVDSPIIKALCKAAKQGKDVRVLVELKARFDEERNLKLLKRLQKSGVKVFYGSEELKTHCKFLLITKKTSKGEILYSHIGTGNYNEKTARIYTDISYFTADASTNEDLLKIFNILEKGQEDSKLKLNRIFYSPSTLRKQMKRLIREEAEKGKGGKITIKVNSLSDEEIINELYKANDKGCRINIICRGACSATVIKEGRRRKRFNIKSIVGRYLEHSRIFRFGIGRDAKVFISSADLLSRNLDRRFELMIPILDDECRREVCEILHIMIIDQYNSYEEVGYGQTAKVQGTFNSHEEFMKRAMSQKKKIKSDLKDMLRDAGVVQHDMDEKEDLEYLFSERDEIRSLIRSARNSKRPMTNRRDMTATIEFLQKLERDRRGARNMTYIPETGGYIDLSTDIIYEFDKYGTGLVEVGKKEVPKPKGMIVIKPSNSAATQLSKMGGMWY